MALWSHLDDFGVRGDGPAYKQVEAMTAPPAFHGSRLWRCQAEMVGRLLRTQGERKKQFVLILPILKQGMIQPKTEARRAGKNRKAIREALADVRKANEDGGNTGELQSLIEQACTEHLSKVEDWGAWLKCSHCGWSGSRDYAAALNIARLGATFITHYRTTGRFYHASIAEKVVNPVSYIGTGPVLRLPPGTIRGRLLDAGRIYINGWKRSVTLRSSYPTETMLRFCG